MERVSPEVALAFCPGVGLAGGTVFFGVCCFLFGFTSTECCFVAIRGGTVPGVALVCAVTGVALIWAVTGMALVGAVTGVVGTNSGSQGEGFGIGGSPTEKSVAQGAAVIVGWLTLTGVGVEGKRLCGVSVPWGRGVVPGVFCLFGGW